MLSQRNVNAVNDLPDHRMPGYLFLGVQNDGTIDGLKVDDALMKRISAIRSDGNILPLPVMSTEKVVTEKGDVLVVEVTPSFDTPVRYRGRTFIRIGPRRDIASAEEERILAERCAASLPTFDTRPCREAKLEDIDIDTTAFSVVVRDPSDVNLLQSCHERASNLYPQAKSLIIGIEYAKMTVTELQLVSELASSLSPKSKLSFKKHFINPNLDAGLLARTYPDNPRHPQQRYYLTELGLAVLEVLKTADSPQL